MRRARAALERGELLDASESLRRATKADASLVGPRVARARVLLDLGDVAGAARAAEGALRLDVAHGPALAVHACVMMARGRYDRALPQLEKVVELERGSASHWASLGDCLVLMGDLARGEQAYAESARLDPMNRAARVGLALVREQRGEPREAAELLDAWIAAGDRDSPMVSVWASAARRAGRREQAEAVLVEALQRGQAPPEEARVGYTLGAIRDSQGDYEGAFEAYARANGALAVSYDPEEHERWVDEEIYAFSPERFAHYAKNRDRDERPIFIVGMPRSGTSLTEQILERHPRVHAAGELSAMSDAQEALPELLHTPRPEHYAAMTERAAREVARHWLQAATGGKESGALRITDKMPENYLALGLVALALPQARVVCCRRDPRDIALSCFFQNFGQRMPFTRRLDWLSQRIQQQRRVLEHFQEVLPLRFFELSYEALVADPEEQIRSLLDFCELGFDEACLHPERSTRHVATASYAQVKRPIHSGSAGRHRNYANQLEDFVAAL